MRPIAYHALHRWTRWVLAAWLCVALGAAWSPLARAQAGMGALEPLCGMDGASHWVASPASQLLGGEVTAAGHGLDCPLCLPVLAPPPTTSGVAGASAPSTPLGGSLASAPWVYRVAAALPARGPPAFHYS